LWEVVFCYIIRSPRRIRQGRLPAKTKAGEVQTLPVFFIEFSETEVAALTENGILYFGKHACDAPGK